MDTKKLWGWVVGYRKPIDSQGWSPFGFAGGWAEEGSFTFVDVEVHLLSFAPSFHFDKSGLNLIPVCPVEIAVCCSY